MTTLYEHARGEETLHRAEELFYSKVLADPLLKTLFTERMPDHVEHLTWFTAESFGGPDRFTRELGFQHIIEQNSWSRPTPICIRSARFHAGTGRTPPRDLAGPAQPRGRSRPPQPFQGPSQRRSSSPNRFCDTSPADRRGGHEALAASVGEPQPSDSCASCFENRQRSAGTRLVHQQEHVRARAGTADTPLAPDLQDKRVRR
jgi:hypothetical protein